MTARFGSFELDSQRRQLSRTGQLLHLTPKSFDLLLMLVEAAPRVVRKAEIHEHLWPSGVVTDATLASLVKEIRRALESDPAQPPMIRTVHRVGYALDVPVTRAAPALGGEHWLLAGGRRMALAQGENIIGRDPGAQVWLDHATLSRRHARLTVHPGFAVLEDLGSKNGTHVDGNPLDGPATLHSGASFACGQLQFTYHQPGIIAPTASVMGYPGPMPEP